VRGGLALFSLVAWLLGVALRPVPTDLDVRIGFSEIAGAFFTFCFFASCVFAWGRALSGRLFGVSSGPGMKLALGTAAAALCAALLGHLGFVGPKWVILHEVLLLSGVLLDMAHEGPRPSAGRLGLPAMAVGGIIALAAASVLVGASIPRFHSDPLWDHLVGPRLWSDEGRIFLPLRDPMVLKCSYWQYLLLWGNSLLTGPDGKGLLEVQLFGQWLHALAFAATASAIYELAGNFSRFPAWRALSALAGVSSELMCWTARFAKDDYGTLLWNVAGLVAFINASERTGAAASTVAVASGIVVGVGAAAKVTSVVPLACFLCVHLVVNRRRWFGTPTGRVRLGAFALGAAAAAFPFVARNWWLTGSPTFPMLNEVFGSPLLSLRYGGVFSIYQGRIVFEEWQLFADRIVAMMTSDPLALALIPALGVLAWRRALIGIDWLLAGPVLSLAVFLLTMGPPVGSDDGTLNLRLAGMTIALGAAFAPLALEKLLTAARSNGRLAAAVGVAVAAISVGQLGRQFLVFPVIAGISQVNEAIRTLPIGGLAKTWLRLHANPCDLVVSTGDNQSYYLLQLNYLDVTADPAFDRWFAEDAGPAGAVRVLVTSGARWVLDTRHWDTEFWTPLSANVGRFVDSHPEVLAYADPRGFVIDGRRLAEVSPGSCRLSDALHPWPWGLGGCPERPGTK
jgi:hypothetical protein